jgi:hypothetical protein
MAKIRGKNWSPIVAGVTRRYGVLTLQVEARGLDDDDDANGLEVA